LDNLEFNDTQIIYPIKFQFQNLKRDAKENAALMMTTWSLIFDVTSTGNVTGNNSMVFNLIAFKSQGLSFARAFTQANKKDKEDDDWGNFMKSFSKIAGASEGDINELSLIFSSQSEAAKFKRAMTKQIDDGMKVLIAQFNNKFDVKNVIKQPTITVTINNGLIGDSNIQTQNKSINNGNDIESDMKEIIKQIEKYKDQDQYQDYVKQLKYIYNKLSFQIKQQNNKR
jgi:hypothetical protein